MPDYSFGYSFPYLFFLFFYFLFVIIEYRKNGNVKVKFSLRFFSVSLFLWFVAFRGFIGFDWANYYPFYEAAASISQPDKFSTYLSSGLFEIGFLCYVSFFKTFGFDYSCFIFLTTLIDILIIDWFLNKYSPNYSLSFLCFLVMGGLVMEIDLLRNMKGLVLFLLSFPFLANRKLFPFLCLNLLGISFHISSLLYIPLFWLLRIELSKKVILGTFIIGNILFLFQVKFVEYIFFYISSLLGGKFEYLYNVYFNVFERAGSVLSIGYIERTISFLLFYNFYQTIRNQPFGKYFINLYFFYFLSFFYLSEIVVLSSRFSNLFIVSYWILLPMVFNCLLTKSNKLIYICAFFAFSFLRIGAYTNNVLFRYENVLYDTESYQKRMYYFDRFNKK